MDINHLCARKIRNLREYNNYTQAYVAEELVMSQNAYSLLEKGTTKITIDRLVSLAKTYNTTASELIIESTRENPATFNVLIQNDPISHSNHPPTLSQMERLLFEKTISRLEKSIEKQHDLILKLTNKISDAQ